MARSPVWQNLILAACVLAAAVILFFWACPFLMVMRHQRLCIALYVLLLVIYVFGRAIFARPRGNPAHEPRRR
jgi:hypothetical protein